MENYSKDIYTEPDPNPETLANLGPLTQMAGIWIGERGVDVSPKAEGSSVEHDGLSELTGELPWPSKNGGRRR
jgi:hypothetical protein